MPVDDHLLKDERILARAEASEEGTLYATNKRVIRYKEGFFGEKMDSLNYRHIVGASYESQSYMWLALVGAVIVVLGLLSASFLRSIGAFVLVALGILVALLGIFLPKTAWYQLKAAGLTREELRYWRTANVEADAKTFARFIQGQIGTGEAPPPRTATKEREVIIKEIVMVKCDYCGALMPQTATFCPNCGGARRI